MDADGFLFCLLFPFVHRTAHTDPLWQNTKTKNGYYRTRNGTHDLGCEFIVAGVVVCNSNDDNDDDNNKDGRPGFLCDLTPDDADNS